MCCSTKADSVPKTLDDIEFIQQARIKNGFGNILNKGCKLASLLRFIPKKLRQSTVLPTIFYSFRFSKEGIFCLKIKLSNLNYKSELLFYFDAVNH